jgi:hypothetical protein
LATEDDAELAVDELADEADEIEALELESALDWLDCELPSQAPKSLQALA